MEPVGPNKMCEEGVSDLMKNLLPERYLYKLISHHVNEYTENTISCDLEFFLNLQKCTERFTRRKASHISQQTQTLNKDKLFEKKIYVKDIQILISQPK